MTVRMIVNYFLYKYFKEKTTGTVQDTCIIHLLENKRFIVSN